MVIQRPELRALRTQETVLFLLHKVHRIVQGSLSFALQGEFFFQKLPQNITNRVLAVLHTR